MQFRRYIIFVLVASMIYSGCRPEADNFQEIEQFSNDQLNVWNKVLTDAMVRDIFSPPVASRIYAYANIAAYEILSENSDDYSSLTGTIPHLEPVPTAENLEVYRPLSAAVAFSEVAQNLVYSYEFVLEEQAKFIDEFHKLGLSKNVIETSVSHGKKVAEHILKWANDDGYKSRNLNSQVITDLGEGTWKPTPPDFLEPIEPNWTGYVRSLSIHLPNLRLETLRIFLSIRNPSFIKKAIRFTKL